MFRQIVVLQGYVSLHDNFGVFSIYAVMVHKINIMFLELLGRSHFADQILYKIGPFYLYNAFYKDKILVTSKTVVSSRKGAIIPTGLIQLLL